MDALSKALDRARVELGLRVEVSRLCYGDELSAMMKSDADEPAEERIVLGVAMEPTDGSDGSPIKPDTDNQVYSPEDTRKACFWYAEHGLKKGFLHGAKFGGFIMEPDDTRVVLLMSWVTPVAIPAGTYGPRQKDDIKAGTWLIAFRVNDDPIWEAVKRGEINGLSIGAMARARALGRN